MRNSIPITLLALLTSHLIQASPLPGTSYPSDWTCSDSETGSESCPGDRQSDDRFCDSFTECGASGLRYWNILQTTLLSPHARDRTDGPALFQQHYAYRHTDASTGMKPFEHDLVAHGFDVGDLENYETVSRNAGTGEAEFKPSPAYDNSFDTRGGLLVANANFREWDSRKSLPWSEIIFQTWHAVSLAQGGHPISSLRTIIRKEVENEGTQLVLRRLYTVFGLSIDEGVGT
ncbi:MAG: hypothetical protein Q9174_004688, partial [Haloplaca sp. 1 TL-2023]